MTLSIALVLSLGALAVVLFAGGWLRMDLVALMVLCALAVTGLVSPEEALAGFSSPAVVIVWAMFVLSAGLSRTGMGDLLGRPLHRLARQGERALVVGLMAVASLLSALMNTVSVATILLPVTMDLARRRRCSPSRLLLPMALGCLLGAPFTAVSATSNILITDALRVAGLQPFHLFDFAPPTALVVAAGMTFVVVAGRRLLPDRAAPVVPGAERLGRWYGLQEHVFTTSLAPGSPLAGKTIDQCRLGSALHLTVLAILREGRLELAPGPREMLREGDMLLLHGQPDHQQRLQGRQHLLVTPAPEAVQALGRQLVAAEAQVSSGSPLAGVSVRQSGLRASLGCHLLAVRRNGELMRERLQQLRLEAGDVLILKGQVGRLQRLVDGGLAVGLRLLPLAEVRDIGAPEVLGVRVPPGSVLVERSLKDSGLGRAFGVTVLGIVRGPELAVMPRPDEPIRAGDLLLVLGSAEDLAVLDALQALELSPGSADVLSELESLSVGVLEAVLAPRASVAGKTMGELRFREQYGLTVLAVLREGEALRDGLQDLELRYGDALLVHGPRARLEELAGDPDFLVLDREAAQAPRVERAVMAGAIVAGVLLATMAGWLRIDIAALVGVVLMVLTRILSMDEAYRAIDWRAVFLIAGLLPLGTALERTGAAQLLATQLIGFVGGFGPRAVIAALFLVTAAATQVLPSPALAVIMAPIALTAAKTLSLSPYPLLMTVALASAANFATPTAHAALVLVMGPGCYRFVDYLKLGVPLTVMAGVVAVLLVPVMWPP